MSYESVPVLQYCSSDGSKHIEGISFCSKCHSGRIEIIDLLETPPRTTRPTQPPSRVAAVQRDIVNNRLRTAQNTRSNAGSNALSSRAMTGPRTTTQNFLFTFVLISESFYYTSQEDREYDLPTILTRKHIGIYLTLTCCTIQYLLIIIIGNVVTQLPNYPFQSTTHFITEHMIPRILPGRYKFFVRDKAMLRFGVGPIAVAGKTPPTTSELALQEGDVIDIQGLLGYLVCDGKENYIVHLVLGREDNTMSYEPSGSTPLKEGPSIKKESKRPPSKKVKQEPKVKVSLYKYILILFS